LGRQKHTLARLHQAMEAMLTGKNPAGNFAQGRGRDRSREWPAIAAADANKDGLECHAVGYRPATHRDSYSRSGNSKHRSSICTVRRI